MTKFPAEELAINLLFLFVLSVLALMLLPNHNLILALRGCGVCTDWGSDFGQFVTFAETIFANFVMALHEIGRLASSVGTLW